MEEWIDLIVRRLAKGIEVCGVLVIMHGVGRAIYTYLRHRESGASPLRLLLARQLALGLEFELAAGVLLTIIKPSWEHIGLLAAIIILRAVLSFSLERELEAMERRKENRL